MQNLIFKGLNGHFKIAAATQYITRIKDSTNNNISICVSVKLGVFSIYCHSDFEVLKVAITQLCNELHV